ncbi:hypothetical protein F2P81_006223 [Scophthalmus maximus]|uniref:Glucagon / GIP / secretin / VIP family domain-containing protein n=1 Tax=Scophthalmus maximus TaxID=52904 RepID=A0A6A4T5B6_SCOMX|nr:hypothetical protein F2P81_006223 [Scophthalmus maximus]
MKIKSKSSENNIYLSRQEILIVTILIMSTVSVTQVFLLSALLHLTTSLPVRQLLSAGLDRRRQLGDIEFSNRYAEFLRSKAKHSSICSFLRRMQGIKKSGVGADVERVNLLLKQYMCPSVYNNWPTDL